MGPITLRLGLLQSEEIHLLVLEGSTVDVILGRPWLVKHNPILSRSTDCFPGCFPVTPSPAKKPTEILPVNSTSIESPVKKQSVDIPPCYAPFNYVFCPKQASHLPTHQPWDGTMDLIPGESVPREKMYPLLLPEQKTMEEYIKEALGQG